MPAKPTASPSAPAPAPKLIPEGLQWPARLLLAAIFIFLVGSQIHPLGDPDIYVHMRDGRYWVETGFDFGPDPFAYTIPGKNIDKIEVLFCTGMYLAWKVVGFDGLIIIKAVLLATAFALLGWLIYRRWPRLEIAGLLLAGSLSLPTLIMFFRERPYVFTYLLLIVSLWLLAWDREKEDWRKLAVIPALVIPWVNLHPAFLVLFGFLGAHWVEAGLNSWLKDDQEAGRRLLRLTWTIAACVVAGAFNPMGFGIYHYAITHSSSELFMKFIQEWNPLQFPKYWDIFALMAVAWLAQLLTIKKTRFSDVLILAIFTYMAVTSYRNVPLFLIAALPPLAGNLRQLLEKYLPQGRQGERIRKVMLLAVAVAVLGSLTYTSLARRTLHLGKVPNYYATDAIHWFLDQPFHGRFLSPIHWADYISWKSHGKVKIFMDGRLLLFGEKLFWDYMEMTSGNSPKIPALLDQYRIDALLVDATNHPDYFRKVTESGQWALVFFDSLSYLFLRRTPANEAIIQQWEYRRLEPWKPAPFFFDQGDKEASVKELERAVKQAPGSMYPLFLLGQLLMGTGSLKEADEVFRKVVAMDPEEFTAHYNLGFIAYRLGNMEEALQRLRIALRLGPKSGNQRETVMNLMNEILQGP